MSRTRATPFEVSGRTVFITGAARGIGAATAERLHRKGANVALVGLEPERLRELADRLGERAAAFEADVTDFEALQRAVASTVERFGGIDVAIANAGVAFTGTLTNGAGRAGRAHARRQPARRMAHRPRGDRAAHRPPRLPAEHLLARAIVHPPLIGAYTAAKAGVEALSDTSAHGELAPSGAQVGCAYFGFLDTDLVRAGYAQPSAQVANGSSPSFIRNPAPLSKAIDAIERGIERRSARVWAPRWVGPMIALRGVLQPLVERRVLREPERLAEAIRLADPSSAAVAEQDPLLGVAAQALKS